MEYSNNHYIPQFILRRFGTKINRYNIETGEIRVKGSIINAFSGKNIYPEWLEHKFADLESKIANLIDNKILNADKVVTISRAENMLIKKFFAAATLRVPDASIFSKKHLEDETFLSMVNPMKITRLEHLRLFWNLIRLKIYTNIHKLHMRRANGF